MKVASIVVLYNPSYDTIINVLRNSSLSKETVVVDNSPIDNGKLFSSIENLTYIHLGANRGIGYALNKGIDFLKVRQYEWYLTLDQDSSLPLDFFRNIEKVIEGVPADRIGIISPIHLKDSQPIESDIEPNTTKETYAVMMSGNLLSRTAYDSCGGFNEEMFIDYVDTEYCLRLKSRGYKVYISSLVSIEHSLGDSKWYKIGSFNLKPTNHNYLRRYYISRNRVEVFLKYGRVYPKFFIIDVMRYIKELCFVILFEKDKVKKIRSIVVGTFDGFLRKKRQVTW